MKIANNPALVERLAAEYVLGSLRGGARRRFETLLVQHATMRRTVAEWQDRIMPLAQFAPAVTPPPAVWQRIEKRLGIAPPSWWQQLLASLNFWRNLGVVSTALASVLLAVLLLKPDAPVTSYVATLENDQAQTVALVTGDSRKQELSVKLIKAPMVTSEQTLQLWAVPKQGNPRSLGLVALQRASDGSLRLPMPANMTPQTIPLLAISLEPKGGSTNPNGPSGPILFKGAWLQL